MFTPGDKYCFQKIVIISNLITGKKTEIFKTGNEVLELKYRVHIFSSREKVLITDFV